MLLYRAAVRRERRQRHHRTLDAGFATVGGKALTDHLKRLKD